MEPLLRDKSQISGVVLCGGPSSRMGQDKAWLTFAGQPLWERAALTIAPFVEQVFLGVGTSERFEDARWQRIRDKEPGLGPIGGLEAALSQVPGPWVLLVGCDLPGVGQTALEGLMQGPEGTEAVVQYGRYEEPVPLCALYHRSILPAVRGAIGAGKRKMTSFMEQEPNTPVRWIPATAAVAKELRNVNRPGEWEAWLEEQSQAGGAA